MSLARSVRRVATRNGASLPVTATTTTTSTRGFAAAAVRGKELAGQIGDLKNMRHSPRNAPEKLVAPIVNPAGRTYSQSV